MRPSLFVLVMVVWCRVANGVELISEIELIRMVFDSCIRLLKDMVVNCLVDVMVSVRRLTVNRSLKWEEFRCHERILDKVS